MESKYVLMWICKIIKELFYGFRFNLTKEDAMESCDINDCVISKFWGFIGFGSKDELEFQFSMDKGIRMCYGLNVMRSYYVKN